MNKKLVYFIIGFAVFAATMSFYFYNMFASPNILVKDEDVPTIIEVKENIRFGDFVNDLYNRKIIHHPESFHFVATVLDYKENMKPGKFKLTPEMTNVQAIRFLMSDTTALNTVVK